MSTITNNKVLLRYEQSLDGQIIFADYKYDGGILYLTHIEAPPVLRGTGAAGKFMEALMLQIEGEGLEKIVPVCSYAAAWISRHNAREKVS